MRRSTLNKGRIFVGEGLKDQKEVNYLIIFQWKEYIKIILLKTLEKEERAKEEGEKDNQERVFLVVFLKNPLKIQY